MQLRTIEIQLTRGLVALIDDADVSTVSKWKWQAKRSRNTWYALRTGWSNGHKTCVLMHHVVFGRDGLLIDHVDGNGLNNTRDNLRSATNRQNCQNRIALLSCSSKFKGVDFYKRSSRWRARIKIDGKLKHLGEFQNEIDAALCYDAAAKIHFGEFARTNF